MTSSHFLYTSKLWYHHYCYCSGEPKPIARALVAALTPLWASGSASCIWARLGLVDATTTGLAPNHPTTTAYTLSAPTTTTTTTSAISLVLSMNKHYAACLNLDNRYSGP